MSESFASNARSLYSAVGMVVGTPIVFFLSMHFGAPWWAAIFLALFFGSFASLLVIGVCMGIDWLITGMK